MTCQDIIFKPIGIIHSCFKQKFGIPRQSGLAPAASATVTFFPPFHRQELFEGLEVFSHLWIHFIFHATLSEGWRPTVRPPRLGGKQRRGVFATRATHRPNPLGSSVVKFEGLEITPKEGVKLHLSGVDLLDQTPVIDIKPYLPYSDKVDDASEVFLNAPHTQLSVIFTDESSKSCQHYLYKTGNDLKLLITQVLQQDPRPAYLRKTNKSEYWVSLWDMNIGWQIEDGQITVFSIENIIRSSTLK